MGRIVSIASEKSASGGALIHGFCLESRSAALFGGAGPNINDRRIGDTVQKILSKDFISLLVCGARGQKQS
jgi:hypothetical protein